SVFLASPDRFHLDMLDALEKDCRFGMIEILQGLCDGCLGPALRVGLDGVDQETIEGGAEMRNEFPKLEFGDESGVFGDNHVYFVGESFLEGWAGFRCGGSAE